MRKGVIFERDKDELLSDIKKDKARVNDLQDSRRFQMSGVGKISSDVDRLDSLVRGCRRMLFRVRAFFPFDLFPDEIIIDECKISVVFRQFFFSEDIHSINIEMIRDVDVETGPFFAKLQIVPDGYPSKPLVVRYLLKKDANRARSVIQGLMVAKRNNIDLGKVDDPDLVNKLEILGKTHTY